MIRGLIAVKRRGTDDILAMIVRKNFSGAKYNFLMPASSPLQLGVNFYGAGETIRAHRHIKRKRLIHKTQEFIFVAEGSLTLFLYEKDRLRGRFLLRQGDSVLLSEGGHGFKVGPKTKLVEIKQGPYVKFKDKVFLPSLDR